MKPEFKTLEDLFKAARSNNPPADESVPYGFPERVVANWRAMDTSENFFTAFQRVARVATICSWTIACVTLFCVWQAGTLSWANSASDWSNAFGCYYVNIGE